MLWSWSPPLALVAWLSVLATRLRGIIEQVNWNSDVVSPMVLTGALANPAHTTVFLGNSPLYSTMLLDAIARPLPSHRVLWEAWPYASALGGALLLGWTVYRVAGAWAGMLATVLAVAVAPSVLFPLVTQGVHELTVLNAIVLGALLIHLLRSPGRVRNGLLCLVVGAVTGINVASDHLLVVAGAIPFGVVLLLSAGRTAGRRRTMLIGCGAAVVVTAAIGWYGTLHVAHHFGVFSYPQAVHTRLSLVGPNMHLIGAVFAYTTGALISPDRTALCIGIAVTLILVAFAAWACLRLVRPVLRRTPVVELGDADLRDALIGYWSILVVLSLAGFLLTDFAVDVSSIRYLIPLYLGVAASLALASALSGRGRAVAATLSLALAGATTFALATTATYRFPLTRDIQPVISVLEAKGLQRGYADYWESNAVTWNTDSRVEPRAVLEGAVCSSQVDPGRTCPYLFNASNDWFDPKPGQSFVIVDPLGSVNAPPSQEVYGPPSAVYQVGRFTVYVYSYDIAARMRPDASSRSS